jgi:hypothetical protein
MRGGRPRPGPRSRQARTGDPLFGSSGDCPSSTPCEHSAWLATWTPRGSRRESTNPRGDEPVNERRPRLSTAPPQLARGRGGAIRPAQARSAATGPGRPGLRAPSTPRRRASASSPTRRTTPRMTGHPRRRAFPARASCGWRGRKRSRCAPRAGLAVRARSSDRPTPRRAALVGGSGASRSESTTRGRRSRARARLLLRR